MRSLLSRLFRPRHADVVLVLGIARSGTSCVSGALSAAGVDFGSGLKPADWQNPKGNFEDEQLYRLNERLLSCYGSSWSSARELPEDWRRTDAMMAEARELERILAGRFGKPGLHGLKDPRLVPLFPVYEEVFKRIGVAIWPVIVKRKKTEVLRSIERSGYFPAFTPQSGDELYRFYMDKLDLIRSRSGAVSICYNELIERPAVEAERLCRQLPFGRNGLAVDMKAAAAWVDQTLYRNRS
ncbi:MAG: hypothetical protein AAF441_24675 [Pseudomonadota bacterium]